MPIATIGGIPETLEEIRNLGATIKHLGAIYEASLKWRWRLLAIIVTIASVISAIFQVLNFFN